MSKLRWDIIFSYRWRKLLLSFFYNHDLKLRTSRILMKIKIITTGTLVLRESAIYWILCNYTEPRTKFCVASNILKFRWPLRKSGKTDQHMYVNVNLSYGRIKIKCTTNCSRYVVQRRHTMSLSEGLTFQWFRNACHVRQLFYFVNIWKQLMVGN